MSLDHYTHERLAYSHIAECRSLAEGLRTFERLEEKRRQEQRTKRDQWFLRLLRPLAIAHIPNLSTLHRL
jgi:hypothetical protein